MQEKAHQIWDRIESSTNQIMEQNMEAAEQYEQTLKQLDQINQTVHFLLDLTNTLKAEVDEKLGWITNYIGDTGTDDITFVNFFAYINFFPNSFRRSIRESISHWITRVISNDRYGRSVIFASAFPNQIHNNGNIAVEFGFILERRRRGLSGFLLDHRSHSFDNRK